MTEAAATTTPESTTPEATTPEVTTPAVPEATVPETPTTKEEPKVPPAEFEPTGDPALDVALDYAAAQGLTPTSPEIEAARTGDFAKLEAYLKEKQAPGWEKQVALAKSAYNAVVEKNKTAAEATAKLVYGVAGSQANWDAAREFVGRVADQAQKDQINAALNQGGLVAEAMAKFVVSEWKAQATKGAKNPAPGAARTEADAPLSAKAYAQAVSQLHLKNRGRDITQLAEYKELGARRLAARNAGH